MELEQTKQLCESLMIQHKLGKVWKFKWIKGCNRRYGYCDYYRKEIRLSPRFVLINNEFEVKDCILHEIAHALSRSRKKGHNKNWRNWCLRIGARPERTNCTAEAPRNYTFANEGGKIKYEKNKN